MHTKYCYLLIAFLTVVMCNGQVYPETIAKFSFNSGSDVDEVSKRKIKLIGTNFTEDRFGNTDHAVFLSGHAESYINLGNYKALKPKSGSISLWVKIENKVSAGTGLWINPILITKCYTLDSFYEAYSIYFDPEEKK